MFIYQDFSFDSPNKKDSLPWEVLVKKLNEIGKDNWIAVKADYEGANSAALRFRIIARKECEEDEKPYMIPMEQ